MTFFPEAAGRSIVSCPTYAYVHVLLLFIRSHTEGELFARSLLFVFLSFHTPG